MRPHKLIKLVIPLLVTTLVVSATLGYGWWHAATHGSLYVSLFDNLNGSTNRLSGAELRFLDGDGAVLAEAGAQRPYATVYVTRPAQYACTQAEPGVQMSQEALQQWPACFEKQSRWLVSWVKHVRYVDLTIGACKLTRIPVTFSTYNSDWWLWWVPLPHAGGQPYTSYHLSMTVDPVKCAVIKHS